MSATETKPESTADDPQPLGQCRGQPRRSGNFGRISLILSSVWIVVLAGWLSLLLTGSGPDEITGGLGFAFVLAWILAFALVLPCLGVIAGIVAFCRGEQPQWPATFGLLLATFPFLVGLLLLAFGVIK